jgi:hypothetical protein
MNYFLIKGKNPIFILLKIGEMQEWLNWHAWKACVPRNGTGGSNPPLSAEERSGSKKYAKFTGMFFVVLKDI